MYYDMLYKYETLIIELKKIYNNLVDYMLWFVADYVVFLGDANQQLWTTNYLETQCAIS